SALFSGLPATSTPDASASFSASRRSSALRCFSSGPWQAKHLSDRIGRTSRLKSISAARAGSARAATAKAASGFMGGGRPGRGGIEWNPPMVRCQPNWFPECDRGIRGFGIQPLGYNPSRDEPREDAAVNPTRPRRSRAWFDTPELYGWLRTAALRSQG